MRPALAVLCAALLGACHAAPPNGAGNDAGGRSRPTATPPAAVSRATTGDEPTRIVVVGDMGTGESAQRSVAEKMCRMHERIPFGVVVTTGDNVYDSGAPEDFDAKFFEPYGCLFERGVTFRASLGNHDIITDGGEPVLAEEAFGMKGRFYSFREGPVKFIVLNSNRLGPYQLRWLDRKLRRGRGAPWLVAVMHHPAYSGGARHGSDLTVRRKLHRRFKNSGVDLVLAGHEHLYSRARAGGVPYVITGGGGASLYPCATEPPPAVRKCASLHHFLLLTATPDSLRLRVIAPDGQRVEALRIPRRS